MSDLSAEDNAGSKLNTRNEVAISIALGSWGVLAFQQLTNRTHLKLEPCKILMYERAVNGNGNHLETGNVSP